MKILVLIGSPRNGNTLETVRKIEAIHRHRAVCEYEYVSLKDGNLQLCRGCHLCLTRGEQWCPLKDDRDILIRKIEDADGVILASPTHSMNVSWVMKNFMDRLSYLMHRPRFFHQKFMLLTVSGSIRGGKDALRSLAFAAFGSRIVSRLVVLNAPGMNEEKREKQEEKIRRAALQFTGRMSARISPRPSLVNMLWFSAFKAVSHVNADACPADHAWYREKRYFVDTGLGALHRAVIGVLTGFFTFLVSRGFV